ncbi:hypothetical protein BHE90_009800 [Fusarium euwallaceae]|uniref:Dipeptidyl-peptidase V n=1 Tax=Fusarium euwallaceae TaxID=1147111 RepID=A0A430LJ38_9HYPO|nr:hypothetical protein BHE90_009800 [Fusarium euwallaceae]
MASKEPFQLPGSMAGLEISPLSSNKRTVKTDDIAKLTSLDDLVLSPDGSQAIFGRSDLDNTGKRRKDTFWLLDVTTKTAKPFLENEEHEGLSHIVWSPTGDTIGLLLAKDGPPQLHVVSTSGTGLKHLTCLPDGVEEFLWSPDGRQIAILSVIPEEDTLPDGVTISTRADFRTGDEPFKSACIYMVDSSGKDAPRHVMSASLSITLSFWSSNGKALYYTVDEAVEPYYGNTTSSLVSVSITDGLQLTKTHLTVPGKSESLGAAPTFVPSPDGTRVAFSIGNPDAPSDFAQDEIFVIDLATGDTGRVTDGYDREVGGDGFEWLDNDRLIAINSDHGNANLVEIHVHSHTVTPWWTGQRVVSSFAYARQGKRLLAIASDFTSPGEIYDVSRREKPTVITSINNRLSDGLLLTKPEVILYQGPSGDTIHGYLHKPPSFDPTQKYPMITLAHGGPYAWWSSAYNGDIQAMAAAGYLVFYPNPRGSMSYGQAFASALADKWPGPEYDDIMAGVDHLVTRPYVDGAKLGISGASAGGTLTDWAITHTDRFGAAVSISDIADLLAYWFLGDQPDMEDQAKKPWLDPKDKKLSPITYGHQAKTPTLFMMGTRDVRTPAAAGGEMMFMLLKHLRVPTALIRFEGAGHAIFRSRDARHPGLAVHYLLRWMDLHLKGVPAPEFDVKRVR